MYMYFNKIIFMINNLVDKKKKLEKLNKNTKKYY